MTCAEGLQVTHGDLFSVFTVASVRLETQVPELFSSIVL